MAANTSPIFEFIPICKGLQFTSADTTAKKTLYTAGANGGRVDSITACTNDVSGGVNLNMYLNDGSTDFYIGLVSIPYLAGYGTIAKVEAINILSPNTGYIALAPSYLLKAACNATMVAGKTTDIMALGGDY